MRATGVSLAGRGGLWGALVVAAACIVAVLAPLGVLKAPFAALLVCALPGWMLFVALDDRWQRRPVVVRGGLAVVGSVAVVPVLLYWGSAGHGLGLLRVTACLGVWSAAAGALALLRRTGPDAVPPDPGTSRAQLAVLAAAVVLALLVTVPWMPNGRRLAGGVAESPCSGDWSKHRSLTFAILDTGIPPRNPFVCEKPLTYYYGLYLQAAALVKLGGGGVGVNAALWLLSVALALATPPVLWALGLAAGARPMAAATGSAIVSLVGGLDLAALWVLRVFPELGYWEVGHSGVWATAPRVPLPFANLHWAPQHHGAALMALTALWLVLQRHRGAWRVLGLSAVLVAGAFVSSAYVGLVLTGGWVAGAVLVAAWGLWRREVGALYGAAMLVGAVALGGAAASGVLASARHMVSNERTHLSLALPRLDYADWMVRVLAEGQPRPAGRAGQEGFRGRVGSPRTEWMSGPIWGPAIRALGGVAGVGLQLGLVGLLGLWGLPRAWRQGRGIWLAALCVTWLTALFVENFDLRMRSAGLGWMLLAAPVALALDGAWGSGQAAARRRRRATVALVVLGVPGLGCLAWEVAGVSRPVYFDASDTAVMAWVRTHTPADAVVQAYPDTAPRVTAMPALRYFVWPGYPEFTGRCAVLGDWTHARMFCTAEEHLRYLRALHAAFDVESPELMASRFTALGVDLVLWTSADSLRGASGLHRRLLDERHFAMLYRDGDSFVVRVIPAGGPAGQRR